MTRLFLKASVLCVVGSMLVSVSAFACPGATDGRRCIPQSEARPKFVGKASAYRVDADPSVIVVSITGNAAELLYRSLDGQYPEVVLSATESQIVGPNMSCSKVSKVRGVTGKKTAYQCEIMMRDGQVLDGAAG